MRAPSAFIDDAGFAFVLAIHAETLIGLAQPRQVCASAGLTHAATATHAAKIRSFLMDPLQHEHPDWNARVLILYNYTNVLPTALGNAHSYPAILRGGARTC